MSWGDAEDAQELPNVLQGSKRQEGTPACWDLKDTMKPMAHREAWVTYLLGFDAMT